MIASPGNKRTDGPRISLLTSVLRRHEFAVPGFSKSIRLTPPAVHFSVDYK